jgi:hypothetical protein
MICVAITFGGDAMRSLPVLAIFTLLPLAGAAGETQPKQDFVEFSRLLHAIAVKQLPKQFEDDSGWGQRTEVPADIKYAALRKIVKVGDHLEAPHGAWYRFKGKIEDPAKNLKIAVKEFKKLDAKTYRIAVHVDATIMAQAEWQQWQKGILLAGIETTADVNVTAMMVCDVGLSVNRKKLPPELNIDPKVTELELDVVEFKIRDGWLLKGERAKMLGSELKDGMRSVVKTAEPIVKEAANFAIAEGLREGKGAISAGAIMKALPKTKN